MNSLNNLVKKLAWIGLMLSVVFAGIGFISSQIQTDPPLIPKTVSPGHYSFPHPIFSAKQILYERSGSVQDPFSESSWVTESSLKPVASSLILLGTLTGENSQAIMAEKANPKLVYIIGRGDVLAGEKVVAIGRGYVVLLVGNRRLRLATAP